MENRTWPEIGEKIKGRTRSGREVEGAFLGTDTSRRQYRIALQGAGKVFIAAATAQRLTEEREA